MMWRYSPFMFSGGWGYGGGILWLVVEVVFWAAIIYGAVWLFRGKHTMTVHGEDETGRALDILKERYAKGEITKKEFEEMKKDIS